MRQIKIKYKGMMIGEGAKYTRLLAICTAADYGENFPFRIKIDDGVWLITWHHKDGLKSFELLPDPIPEATLKMWKLGNLRWKFGGKDNAGKPIN